jgi:hypothetical protein
MAQTITPVGHGGRGSGWAASVALHAGGATLTAGLLGAALGGLGLLLGAPWGLPGAAAVAVVAALYAGRELTGLPVPLPDARRQVPEWWRTQFAPGPASFLYGLGLGVGFATHLRHGTLVAAAAAVVASGEPVLGALVLAPFGLARAATVLVARGATDPPRLHRLSERLERLGLSPVARWANGAALLVLALAAISLAGRSNGPGPAPLAAVLLAVVFGWAFLAKVLGPRAWRRALGGYGLPAPIASAALVAVPVAEAAVTILLLAGSTTVGAGLALVLLSAFWIAVVRARRSLGDRLPCGCFGGNKLRDARLMLGRNAALAVLAGAALLEGQAPAFSPPVAGEALPAILALIGAVLTAWILRRAGQLLGRAGAPPPRPPAEAPAGGMLPRTREPRRSTARTAGR